MQALLNNKGMYSLFDAVPRALVSPVSIGSRVIISPRATVRPRPVFALAQQTTTVPQQAENGRAKQQAGFQPLISRQKSTLDQYAEQAYLTARTRRIAKHFPTAIGVDDFLNRLEVALFAYGFTGDNSIGV